MANVELAKAYVTILPSMEGSQASITDQLTEALGAAAEPAGSAAGTSAAAGLAGALSKFAVPAAVVGGIAAAGKAVYDIGSDFDAMYDSIAVGTGATGDALDALNSSAKNVLATVPSAIEDVGQTLADLNTRTGLTGESLEDLSKQFLNLDEIGSSMDINSATGMMSAWGVASEDMSGKLDELFTVSQSTGIGMDSLSSAMSANAATMKQLGFSFEDTASMAGLLDKAGLNASGMMSKMSKACLTLAKDGEAPADAYKRIVGEMQGYIDKGETAKAMSLATDLFGTKGAGQFVQALQTGALNIDQLASSLQNADGAIAANAEGTRDMAESLEIMKNNALIAVEPFASGLFNFVGEAFAAATPYIQQASQWVSTFMDEVGKSTEVQEIMSLVGGAVSTAFSLVGNIIGTVMPAALTVVKAAWQGIKGAFDTAASIASKVSSTFNRIKTAICNPIQTAKSLIGNAVNAIKGFFDFQISWPHIPMPHFSVSPSGWKVGDLLNGSIPSLGIEWYARGGIADGAQLVGVGEAGPEAIVPLQGRYMQPFAQAVADNMGGADTERIIDAVCEAISLMGFYIDGKRVASATRSARDGVDGRLAALARRGCDA